MQKFEREERYVVVKLTDYVAAGIPGYLNNTFHQVLGRVAEYRSRVGKAPLVCAVVESDWPEYEPTWAAIEARVTGEPVVVASQPPRPEGLEDHPLVPVLWVNRDGDKWVASGERFVFLGDTDDRSSGISQSMALDNYFRKKLGAGLEEAPHQRKSALKEADHFFLDGVKRYFSSFGAPVTAGDLRREGWNLYRSYENELTNDQLLSKDTLIRAGDVLYSVPKQRPAHGPIPTEETLFEVGEPVEIELATDEDRGGLPTQEDLHGALMTLGLTAPDLSSLAGQLLVVLKQQKAKDPAALEFARFWVSQTFVDTAAFNDILRVALTGKARNDAEENILQNYRTWTGAKKGASK